MRLERLRILLLISVGLAYVGISSGWALQVHVETAEHDYHCCNHDRDEDSHSQDHDSDSCTFCQHWAVVSKQALVNQAATSMAVWPLETVRASIPGAIFSQDIPRTSSPRAPPMISS